jgi:pentatricopeptide repeat protein
MDVADDPTREHPYTSGHGNDSKECVVDVKQLVLDIKKDAEWKTLNGKYTTIENSADDDRSGGESPGEEGQAEEMIDVIWHPQSCRTTAERYQQALELVVAQRKQKLQQPLSSAGKARRIHAQLSDLDVGASGGHISSEDCALLLHAETVTAAFKVLLKSGFPTTHLKATSRSSPLILSSPVFGSGDPQQAHESNSGSRSHQLPTLGSMVRKWEKYIGLCGQTVLTDHLTFRLLEANGKAGNMGRCLSLLQLRLQCKYPPRQQEFQNAVNAISAALLEQRIHRNIYLSEAQQPITMEQNPTRWLDAILLNMHLRQIPLTVDLANDMLRTFSCSGWTGKAVHHFYRVIRQPDHDDTNLRVASDSDATNEQKPLADVRPYDHIWDDRTGRTVYGPIKIRLKYHPATPPHYKVPAQVQGLSSTSTMDVVPMKVTGSSEDVRARSPDTWTNTPTSTRGQLQLARESDPEYSVALSALFSFAESLQAGACGHVPITLDVVSHNMLMRACVRRGALWRAMYVIDTVMASAGVRPNTASFNYLLQGLARVGDVTTSQEYYHRMIQFGLNPDAYTVKAIVEGFINLGDLPGAVTAAQDFFNQYGVLPPITTHLQILEHCLGLGLVYEAKRYVYFIQQLWDWNAHPSYHSTPSVTRAVERVCADERLSKSALLRLFAYFGEELDPARDFL